MFVCIIVFFRWKWFKSKFLVKITIIISGSALQAEKVRAVEMLQLTNKSLFTKEDIQDI